MLASMLALFIAYGFGTNRYMVRKSFVFESQPEEELLIDDRAEIWLMGQTGAKRINETGVTFVTGTETKQRLWFQQDNNKTVDGAMPTATQVIIVGDDNKHVDALYIHHDNSTIAWSATLPRETWCVEGYNDTIFFAPTPQSCNEVGWFDPISGKEVRAFRDGETDQMLAMTRSRAYEFLVTQMSFNNELCLVFDMISGFLSCRVHDGDETVTTIFDTTSRSRLWRWRSGGGGEENDNAARSADVDGDGIPEHITARRTPNVATLKNARDCIVLTVHHHAQQNPNVIVLPPSCTLGTPNQITDEYLRIAFVAVPKTFMVGDSGIPNLNSHKTAIGRSRDGIGHHVILWSHVVGGIWCVSYVDKTIVWYVPTDPLLRLWVIRHGAAIVAISMTTKAFIIDPIDGSVVVSHGVDMPTKAVGVVMRQVNGRDPLIGRVIVTYSEHILGEERFVNWVVDIITNTNYTPRVRLIPVFMCLLLGWSVYAWTD